MAQAVPVWTLLEGSSCWLHEWRAAACFAAAVVRCSGAFVKSVGPGVGDLHVEGKGQRELASLVIRFSFCTECCWLGQSRSLAAQTVCRGTPESVVYCELPCVTARTARSFWRSQYLVNKVPGVFLNPTVHYRIHKSPAHIHILSLLNSVHALLFTIHFSIIIQSTPVFQAVYCFQFSHHNSVCTYMRATCIAYHIVLDLITRAVCEQTSQLPVASFLFLCCPSVTLS